MAKNRFVEALVSLLGRKREQVISGDIDAKVYEELVTKSELYRLLLDQEGIGLLGRLFYQVAQTKRDLVDLVDSYKDTFFHVMIVERLVDDVLGVDPASSNVVDIYSDNKQVNEILQDLQERIDIDSFISAIAGDIIAYGDYVVKVQHDGTKVVELLDTVDQKDVVVVYRSNKPIFLLKHDTAKGEFTTEEYIKFLHFCIPGRKIKIKLDNVWKEAYKIQQIGDYFRVGKPLFWGCWDLLNSLFVLLVFYPVFAVQKLNASTILGIRIPGEVPPAKAYEIARKYQELLNVQVAVDRLGRVSVADVIDTIGKYKVIPVYDEEKGLIQLNDPRLEESYALDIVEELKRVICATVGVPYQLLFGSVEGQGRLEVLRSFNRYVKKVSRIQSAIREGLTQLALIECSLRGLYVSPELIEVRFRNNIVSVEHLDKLEFLAGMVETVSNSVETVMGVADRLSSKVDLDKLRDFVNDYFGMAGLGGVLLPPEEELKEPSEEGELFGEVEPVGGFERVPPFEGEPGVGGRERFGDRFVRTLTGRRGAELVTGPEETEEEEEEIPL